MVGTPQTKLSDLEKHHKHPASSPNPNSSRPFQSELVAMSQNSPVQPIRDMSSSILSLGSVSERSATTKPSKEISKKVPTNSRSNKFSSGSHKKSDNTVENTIRGAQVNWRTELNDQPTDASDSDWYNGEDNESNKKKISRNWVVVPLPEPTEEEKLALANDETRNLLQPFVLDPAETWQILPRVPKANVAELKKEDEEVRRYHRDRWIAGVVDMGWTGLKMVGEATMLFIEVIDQIDNRYSNLKIGMNGT